MALSYAQKFVGGMILLLAVTVGGNAVIVSMAIRHQDGLVDEQYQDHGLRYDERKVLQENRAGWQIRWGHLPAQVGREIVAVELQDRAGAPLRAASVSLELFRPTQQGHDQRVSLQETTPGHYEAPLLVPLEGIWDLNLDIDHGGTTYRHTRRVKTRKA